MSYVYFVHQQAKVLDTSKCCPWYRQLVGDDKRMDMLPSPRVKNVIVWLEIDYSSSPARKSSAGNSLIGESAGVLELCGVEHGVGTLIFGSSALLRALAASTRSAPRSSFKSASGIADKGAWRRILAFGIGALVWMHGRTAIRFRSNVRRDFGSERRRLCSFLRAGGFKESFLQGK